MTARLDYRWHLRKVMADRGMFSTTDLIGPLAQREITLSSSQVYRLVTERPERLSLKILMALLDILDCAMDDLIEPVAAAGQARRTGEGRGRRGRGCPGHRRPATEAGSDHRHLAVTGCPGDPAAPCWPCWRSWSPGSARKQSSGHWSRRRRARTGAAASQPR